MTPSPNRPAGPRIERLGHRLRAVVGGGVVVDTPDAVVRIAPGTRPTYLVPVADVQLSLLAADAVTKVDADDMDGFVVIEWHAVDRWYAEEDEVIGHARDPRHRVDVLRSGRHVEVTIDDALVASSDRSVVLLETDSPPRYFLSRVTVTSDLRPSATVTASPYLGVARYWSLMAAGERCDVAVTYDAPQPGVAILEHLVAFDERVAEIHVSER